MDGASITYATSKDWLDIMKNRSKVRMHELIERLGLRAKWSSNKRGKTNFESALVRELVADMGDVVSNLPKEPDELMKFLSEEGSLKEDVDHLMEKHGSKVWGRVGDRDHLINVGEPGVEDGIYPRDLYFENDEDKELIRVLLHWWVGLKACNVILARERLDRERKKKEENRKARAEMEHQNPNALVEEAAGVPGSFVALAPNTGTGPPPLNTALGGVPIPATEAARHIFHADSASRGSPISSAMLTPPESSESPIAPVRGDGGFTSVNPNGLAPNGNASAFTTVNPHLAPAGPPPGVVDGVYSRPGTGDINGSRHSSLAAQAAINASSWPPPQHADSKAALQQQQSISQAAAIRQLNNDLSKLVASFGPDETSPPHPSDEISQQNSSTYRGLDIDTLQALRAYIYGEDTSATLDEDTLLNRLEKAWREGVRGDYERIIDNIPVFIARERAFLTWLELKRHLAALERADKRWRSEGTTAPEIERRIQQHRTLMGATQSILVNFEDIGKGFGLDPNVQVDRDEVLRQAFVVLAGEKYAVEMLWKGIEYTGVIRWLGEHLEAFRKDEEEEGRGMLWYVG